MAFSRKRSSRRTHKTDTGETTQKDPVVISRTPEPKVVETIQSISKTPKPVVEAKSTPTGGKYGELEFFTEQFLDDLTKVPADLMVYLSNQEKSYKAMRATNRPGDDERATKLLARLNELRRVCRGIGYAV